MANIFRIKRILKVPPKVMLNVVGDVSKYHEFVPYCTQSVVTQHVNNVPARAKMCVGWSGLSDSFESALKYTENSVVASAAEDSTLFDKLACTWTVQPVSGDKCNAHLDLEFKFSNPVYDAVAGKAGPLVAKKMIQAFSERAIEVAQRTTDKAQASSV